MKENHAVLSSQSLTQQKELLFELENKSSIQLHPSNYDVMEMTGCCQPDLLVSPITGVIFLFNKEENLDNWLEKVFAMVIKCKISHLIFELLFVRYMKFFYSTSNDETFIFLNDSISFNIFLSFLINILKLLLKLSNR